jgi:hypothetical protein
VARSQLKAEVLIDQEEEDVPMGNSPSCSLPFVIPPRLTLVGCKSLRVRRFSSAEKS